MKRIVGTAVYTVLMSAAAACASNPQDPGLISASDTERVPVEAQRDVIVTETPLGDVVSGALEKGQSATAVCLVRGATTNAGFNGSAIKVEAAHVSGYAAVTDLATDPAERQMIFDVDESTLQDRLPSCPE